MKNSAIEWTDHTVNFWWGCSKVSPACANCYAERQDAHFHPDISWRNRYQGEKAHASHWGPRAPRLIRVKNAAHEALRYDIQAERADRSFKVFTNSMSDFFEDRDDLDHARLLALDVIRQTPHLVWLILTKRPERILDLLRRAEADAPGSGLSDWLREWLGGRIVPTNVWLGATVEDQERADQRIPELLRVPAAARFLSCEPLLGPVDLNTPNAFRRQRLWKEDQCLYAEVAYNYPNLQVPGIDWVICGGESGPHARPMHPNWARSLRDQCAEVGVPFFFKQWGEWTHHPSCMSFEGCDLRCFPGIGTFHKAGKKTAGRLLDGVEHNAFPEVARG